MILGILLALFLASLPTQARLTRKQRQERYRIGKQQLEQANRLRANLEGTPQNQRKEKSYLSIVHRYRRVYDIAPFSGIAADALAAAAEMYTDMGKQFDPKYWQKAIETYRFLRREYPHSKYADDALFNIAQIQQVHLSDLEAALATYQDFLRTYPNSRYAPKARQRIQSIRAQRASRQPSDRVEVRSIRYWNTRNYTRVVVDLEGKVDYRQGRISNPDRIFFDLLGTELSTVLNGKTFDVEEGLLHRIRVAKNRSGVTRVVLEVNNAEDYTVFTLPNPFRLVVDIRGRTRTEPARRQPSSPEATPGETPPAETAATSTPQPPATPQPTREGNHTLTRVLGLKVGRIAIDPGHGGHDTGTIGPTGLMEKELTLDIALRLQKLLAKELGPDKVILTREDDSFVPLENRIALANEQQADLFLSIHANSSRNRAIRGVESFILNVSNDPEVLALAARENALAQKSIHELQDLVRRITRNEKLAESREFALEIQQHLHGELRQVARQIRNRGVKQAPFVVLIGGNMPSVLIEISFLSNPQDEKFLKTPEGRQRVAEALLAGMTEYLKNLNSVAYARTDGDAEPEE
ncbi:MAG: N-acetylmuramoyl-L-alanine amidase [Candidatus Acidoferrales bacterium]